MLNLEVRIQNRIKNLKNKNELNIYRNKLKYYRNQDNNLIKLLIFKINQSLT